MSLVSILLQAAGGQSQWSGILMMVVIVAIFYFFMIRPQQKKQKEIQKSREALKTGDKVITAGGIYGKIKEIGDTYMLIEISGIFLYLTGMLISISYSCWRLCNNQKPNDSSTKKKKINASFHL